LKSIADTSLASNVLVDRAPEGVRILLSTSQRLVRDALTEGLEKLGRIRVISTARTASEILVEAERNEPAVVVISDDVGRNEYLDAIRMIVDRIPSCAVLLLAGKEDEDALTEAVEAGIRGFVTRSARVNELCEAIEHVAEGNASIPGSMINGLLDRLLERRVLAKQRDARLDKLSVRERQVLLLLADGESSAAIAKTLWISRETARKHVQNILVKMGVRSRLEAIAYVTRGDHRSILQVSD
jgi:DNA-binding NarL/FixJ family response regulator